MFALCRDLCQSECVRQQEGAAETFLGASGQGSASSGVLSSTLVGSLGSGLTAPSPTSTGKSCCHESCWDPIDPAWTRTHACTRHGQKTCSDGPVLLPLRESGLSPPQTLGAGEAAASEENQGEGKTAGQWAGAITGGAHITVGSLAKSLGTYCYYPFHRRKAEAEEVV